MGKIFGTDGVRGIAMLDLTVDLAMKIGKATAKIFAPNGGKILIGKDTRISSSSLESALAAGISSCGVDVVLVGVVPTPAVAFIAKTNKFDAGIMVSASHNSFEFNGIKIFNSEGFKIDEECQNKIEDLILNDSEIVCEGYQKVGKIDYNDLYVKKYLKYLRSLLKAFDLKVVFDCANGASSFCAGKVFRDFLNCKYLNNSPDGLNINKDCGSTSLENLSDYVISNNFDLGIAFDGDADRCLAVDKNGDVIDGDHIIASLALDMQKNSSKFNNTVVGTLMSNMGFESYLKDHGIKFIRSKIGDRFVAQDMKSSGAIVGGEQSGHIILFEHSTTGDAILSAVMLINLIYKLGDSSIISNTFKQYPQFTKNIKISPENDFSESDEFKSFLKKLESILSPNGRVLARKSGTEPVIRVMCESKSLQDLKQAEDEIQKFESLVSGVSVGYKVRN